MKGKKNIYAKHIDHKLICLGLVFFLDNKIIASNNVETCNNGVGKGYEV